MSLEYLAVLAAAAAVPVALSRDRRLPFRDHPAALLKTVGTVCVLFWTWDVLATARGHWRFNPDAVLGLYLLGMPLEEWLFFAVISFVSVFTWESVRHIRNGGR